MTYLLSFLFLCLVSVCSAQALKIFLLTGQSNSLGAVSYTHLDVYKRQVQTPTGGSSRESFTMGETLMVRRRVGE